MSKNKGKDGADEKLAPDEDLKHDNLNLATEREELYARMQVLLTESKEIKTKYTRLLDEQDELAKGYEECRQEAIRKHNKHKEKKFMLERQREALKVQNTMDCAEWQAKWNELEKSKNEQIRVIELEKESMAAKLDEASKFLKEKRDYLQQIADLKAALDKEKKERLRQVTEKEREKLKATETLRREMLNQIKQTKASLLTLNAD